MNTRNISFAGLMVSLAVLFQIAPVLFTEIFTILTVFSALPVFIIARINPKLGCAAFFVAAFLIMLFSVHEGLFFMCTNGVLGLSLGLCSNYTKIKAVICAITAFVLALTLSIMNFVIGIPVLGVQIPGACYVQIGILFAFSVVYCTVYYVFAGYIFRKLSLKLPF